jgi:hypothetical protein
MKIPHFGDGCSFMMVGINQIDVGNPDVKGELEVSILTKPENGDHPVTLQITLVPKHKAESHFLPNGSPIISDDIPLNSPSFSGDPTIQLNLTEAQAVLLGEFLQMATNVVDEE